MSMRSDKKQVRRLFPEAVCRTDNTPASMYHIFVKPEAGIEQTLVIEMTAALAWQRAALFIANTGLTDRRARRLIAERKKLNAAEPEARPVVSLRAVKNADALRAIEVLVRYKKRKIEALAKSMSSQCSRLLLALNSFELVTVADIHDMARQLDTLCAEHSLLLYLRSELSSNAATHAHKETKR